LTDAKRSGDSSIVEISPSLASLARVALITIAGLAVGACCKTPTVAPATNSNGVYVRALQGDLRAGVVAAPSPGSSLGWPPVTPDPASPCTDEVAALETSLGVASTACPSIQMAQVPGQGGGDAPITTGGFNLKCYPLDTKVLIVEHTETLAAKRCTHVVGLAIFPVAK
jgi:hypothetical protein